MKFEPSDLVEFLDFDKEIRYRKCWPLSLLAFRASVISLALPRKPVKTLKSVEKFITENYKSCNADINWDNLDSAYEDKSGQHKNIPEFCRRHVKPKKQHEIFRLGQLAAAVLKLFGIHHAIDIGSGQGHLSRFLALCYKLNVTTIEAEQSYVSTATHFDKQALKTVTNLKERLNVSTKLKAFCDIKNEVLPHHLEGSMTVETSKLFLNKVFRTDHEDLDYDFKEPFAILGLHTCGDLAATILKMFVECQQSKVLISVGCCYMKNTSDMASNSCPLSSYVKSLPNHHLSYEAKEIACHALEMYLQRLKDDAPSLKIHCYRATLEKCIVHHYPDKKHMGLRGVKHAENMPFPEYAEKALSKVSCCIPKTYYLSSEIQLCLDKWKEVLIFYSLRLMTAPIVESLILLDRMLFLYEHGYPSCLVPLFDPSISPRNYVIVSACRNIDV